MIPTILDLLGIKYNQNYYVSKSAFLVNNELENTFYSHELQSVFTDKLYSYDLESFAYSLDSVSNEYQNEFILNANIVSNKIKLFNRFYEHKLFEYMK